MTRITKINVYPITLPLQKALTWGRGKGLASLEHVVIELVTDQHSVFAEAVPRPSILNETQESVIEYVRRIAQRIYELDLTRDAVDALSNEMFAEPQNLTAKAAINCALYELLARAEGKDLPQYLGFGSTAVPACYIVTQHKDGDALAADLRTLQAKGVNGFKIKLTGDVEVDTALAQATVGFPGCNFYLDGNELYDLSRAKTLLDTIGPMANVLYVEEPLPREQMQDRQALVAYVAEQGYHTRIVGDDSCKTFAGIKEQIAAKTITMVNLKVPRTGISEGLRIAAYCQERGIPVMIGSHASYVIGAYHAWAVAQHPGVQCQLNEVVYWTNVPEDADVVQARPTLENGAITFTQPPSIVRSTLPEPIVIQQT